MTLLRTIAAMDRTTLEQALQHLVDQKSLTSDDTAVRCAEGHRLTFYLGQPGQAMILKEIEAADLKEHIVVLTRQGGDETICLGYDAVHAVAATAPAQRRAGFL